MSLFLCVYSNTVRCSERRKSAAAPVKIFTWLTPPVNTHLTEEYKSVYGTVPAVWRKAIAAPNSRNPGGTVKWYGGPLKLLRGVYRFKSFFKRAGASFTSSFA